jgi:predicted membrane protein
VDGFSYPNEGVIEWDLLIVIYPFITGLVAGAFVVSSLYHVFGLSRFRPMAKLSLLTALAFLLVTPIPLVVHLGQPEKALEMLLRPNLVSAMSGFGYIWFFYLLLVLVEVWLVFRPDIVRYATSSEGVKRAIYTVLALGILEISDRARAVDDKLIKALAMIGIPAACLLHGYVGFIFGAVKANPWWSTPLMPFIFLFSAVVSGMALLIVLHMIVSAVRKVPPDHDAVRYVALWLGGFLTVAFVMEGLEVFSMSYESAESWSIMSELLTSRMPVSYFGVQMFMGAVIPLLGLAIAVTISFKDRTRTALSLVSAALVLVGVFTMRWNVVIGGQLFSKSFRGFNEYTPPLLGEEGILVGVAVLLLPLLIFAVFVYLLPPWEKEAGEPVQKRLSF